jgi:hypothetical protein
MIATHGDVELKQRRTASPLDELGFTALALALLGLAGCLGGEITRHEGASCLGSVECAQELECRYDRCRRTCLLDGDCGSGSACIATLSTVGYDVDFRVCTLPSEELCPELACPTALYCGDDGRCREPCDVDEHCGADRRCNGGVCLESPGE